MGQKFKDSKIMLIKLRGKDTFFYNLIWRGRGLMPLSRPGLCNGRRSDLSIPWASRSLVKFSPNTPLTQALCWHVEGQGQVPVLKQARGQWEAGPADGLLTG